MPLYKVTIKGGYRVGKLMHNTDWDEGPEWLQRTIANYILHAFDLTKPSTILTIEIEQVKDDTP